MGIFDFMFEKTSYNDLIKQTLEKTSYNPFSFESLFGEFKEPKKAKPEKPKRKLKPSQNPLIKDLVDVLYVNSKLLCVKFGLEILSKEHLEQVIMQETYVEFKYKLPFKFAKYREENDSFCVWMDSGGMCVLEDIYSRYNSKHIKALTEALSADIVKKVELEIFKQAQSKHKKAIKNAENKFIQNQLKKAKFAALMVNLKVI